jgi:hypothetical protein
MNRDYTFLPNVYYRVCRDCVFETKKVLSNNNRIVDKIGRCSNANCVHTSGTYLSGVKIDAFYSVKNGKWFFINDERRKLIRELRLAFPELKK